MKRKKMKKLLLDGRSCGARHRVVNAIDTVDAVDAGDAGDSDAITAVRGSGAGFHEKRPLPGLKTYEGATVIPKRGSQGPKDFMPIAGDKEQERKLNATMEELSRIHKCESVLRTKDMSIAAWLEKERMAKLLRQRGPYFRTMGVYNKSHSSDVLYPEEVVFLVEKGCLELHHNGLPLSLLEVRSLCIRTEEEFRHSMVYSYLKRGGVAVRRRSQLMGQYRKLVSSMSRQQRQQQEESASLSSLKSSSSSSDALSRSSVLGSIGKMASSLFSPFMSLLSPNYNSPIPLSENIDRLDFEALLKCQQIVEEVKMIPLDDRSNSLISQLEKEGRFKDELPNAFRRCFCVFTEISSFKRGNSGLPDFVVVPWSAYSELPTLREIRAMTTCAAPAPVKIAIEQEGVLVFHGLMGMELPVYTVQRKERKTGHRKQKTWNNNNNTTKHEQNPQQDYREEMGAASSDNPRKRSKKGSNNN
eukprot:m.91161 g.91161  ORF g.91161 m.91161 type:complete len:472 (+) comp8865_c0_seq3:112-1527(+)